MLESILWSAGIAVFLGIFVGIPYVKGVEPKNNLQPTNKREYVLANLDKFGVKDHGTSLKKKNIYLVSRERIGL
jgi:hypothetical protein